jgi:MFS family permease
MTSTLVVEVTGVLVSALPSVQVHFADVPNVAFWVRLVLTLPSLLIAAVAPIAGYVVDSIGRKMVLVISTLVYGMAGLAGYLAPTLTWLLVSRAALGIAVGGLMTSVTTLIADYYAGEARRRFLGLQAAFMGLGGTAWLALGGVLADVGWRVPFLAYAFAFILLPLILLALYEPLFSEQCVETTPLLPDSGACVSESLRTTRDTPGAAVVSSAPVGLILFVYGVVIGIQVVLFLLPMQLPFYLLQSMGASASRSGLAIAAMSGAYALASMQYGPIASRLDHSELLVVTVALIGLGYFAIWAAGGWVIMLAGLVVVGIGQGLLNPNLSIWLAEATPPALRGRVLGGLTTAVFLGIFASPIIGQPMVAAMGFRVLCLSAGALLLMMAALFWVTSNQLRTLTGRSPLELPVLDLGPCEVQPAPGVQSPGVILTVKEELTSSSNHLPSLRGCSNGLRAAH